MSVYFYACIFMFVHASDSVELERELRYSSVPFMVVIDWILF